MRKNGTDVLSDRRCGRNAEPVMLRRSYDISVACCQRGHENDTPMELSLRGEAECTLLRAVCVTAAAAAGIYAVCRIGKWVSTAHYRRHLRKKYREQLREQKVRAEKDAAAADRKEAEKAAKQAEKAASACGNGTCGGA